MKPRKKASHSSSDRWLVSYADFITLLFAFFVVLYASAQVDRKKVEQLSASIESAFSEMGSFPSTRPRSPHPADLKQLPSASDEKIHPGEAAPKPVDLSQVEHDLRQVLAAEIARREASLSVGSEGLILSLREIGFFESGSAVLREQARPSFSRIASVLGPTPYRIRVEGHTDNIPIHNERFASNWELSTSRATEVVRLLIVEKGFPPERLAAAGYAEFHPTDDNATREGRQNNRRVDIVVLLPK
jgi:chemotaxis protein MotB